MDWLIKKGYLLYYIVDGQQRLTALLILIKAIHAKMTYDDNLLYNENRRTIESKYFYQTPDKGITKTYLFGYEKNDPSNEYFKTQILGTDSTSDQKQTSVYTKNLCNAKEYFEKKIQDFNIQQLDDLYLKLTQKLTFNIHEIRDEYDSMVAFETLNNRGKSLSTLELLKNRLMYISTITPDVPEVTLKSLRNNVNNVWKTIYEYLGKESRVELTDDDFLKNHWIMYFEYNRKTANAYEKYLLGEHFSIKNVYDHSLTLNEIEDYIDDLKISSELWYYIHNPENSDFSPLVKEQLLKLRVVGYGAFEPLILVLLKKSSLLDERDLECALTFMEKYVFVLFKVSFVKSSTGNSYFYSLSNKINKSQSLKGKLDELIEELKLYIYGDDREYSGYIDIDKFKKEIRKRFDMSQGMDGFYGWSGIKHFLLEYEHNLKDKTIDKMEKIEWNESDKGLTKTETIEHILPQNSEKNCWRETFDRFTEEQKYKLSNSLGNLLLLGRRKNSSLQNECFGVKKEGRNGVSGYINGSYSEIEVSRNLSWSPMQILQRGIKLLKFMEEHWLINLGTDEDKKLLLGLEFLKS